MVEDLTGKRFGKLVVLHQKERKPSEKTCWVCQCDCGNITTVMNFRLKSGHTRSCGCLRTRKNNYEFHGDIAFGYTDKGTKFIFDTEDYGKIKDYYWGLNCGYITTKGGFVKMHRVLTSCPDDMVVDHINHNRLDNRKSNLRICNQNENIKNQKIRCNNTSGYSGVGKYKQKNRDCYYAKISINGKAKHLGYYDTIEEAIRVRKEAEQKYYKGFKFEIDAI